MISINNNNITQNASKHNLTSLPHIEISIVFYINEMKKAHQGSMLNQQEAPKWTWKNYQPLYRLNHNHDQRLENEFLNP